MTRPTRIEIDSEALLHNLDVIKRLAPHSQVIAMVKANAYGCGLASILPHLEGQVAAYGVASLEEAMQVRALGSKMPCILFHGLFSSDELPLIEKEELSLVLHTHYQLEWVLSYSFKKPLAVWVKINTGMHRLGFSMDEAKQIIERLIDSPHTQKPVGIMSHFACADELCHPQNKYQLDQFHSLLSHDLPLQRSMANSAAIISIPESHHDFVRPGIMLYGVSPFKNKTAMQLGLKPVMRFYSAISALHHYPAHAPIGYGATWTSDKPCVIGVIPVGYGDGYPRHLHETTDVWINQQRAPIVGRVSMDMLMVDLTHMNEVQVGDCVELWGEHILVEEVAAHAGTIPYELLCQVSPRVRDHHQGHMR